jgi:enediyne biosynthesis protein E4
MRFRSSHRFSWNQPWRWLPLMGWICVSLGCGSNPARPGEAVSQGEIFREVAAETGLDFEHFTGSTGQYFLPEVMGAGVALFDYDGDGDLDVYVLQGTMLDPSKGVDQARFPPPKQHWPGNRLFRNELIPSGKLRFEDVTEEAGVGFQGYGMGVAVGDYDGDGDLDLYVTNFGPNVLYRNNGDGTFTDVTREAGVDDARWSTSAAFVDFDRDGDLDLFFANYIDFTIANNKECFDPTGARDYCTPNAYRPVPTRLFRNEGGGRFVDVSAAAGLGATFGNGLGVICADFDNDGWVDFYVANDGTANQLWRNKHDGTFEDTALMGGAAYDADGRPQAGMGVTAADFDGDGDEDLFMTHLAQETNTLYLNNGHGEFRDETARFGLGAISMPYTGFGSEWFDYDNDGRLDLFIANGAVTIVESLRGEPYPFHQKNLLLRGGEGGHYQDISAQAGAAFELSEVSRGAAFGDIDNDGDIDIVVTNNNGPVRLLRNEVGSAKPVLRVRLQGSKGNREAIGARLALLRKGKRPVWRRAHRDGSYLSSSDIRVLFAVEGETVEGIGVIWPDGQQERFEGLPPEGDVELLQGKGQAWKAAF